MTASEAMPPQSLETLYADHHGWLRGWLGRRLGNSSDAADLAQDTFLRLLRRRVASGPGPGPGSGTLAGSATPPAPAASPEILRCRRSGRSRT